MPKPSRVRTPMVLQMEAVECGAAALAIILAYHGRVVPLPTLRRDCGVSRDGSKASNIIKAAQAYGLTARAFKKDLRALAKVDFPYIVYWNFNHFLVVEGQRKGRVYLNDPAIGRRWVPIDDFERSYTGVMMTMEPGAAFRRGGKKPSVMAGLLRRLRGSWSAVAAAAGAALLLVLPGIATPALMGAFVDNVLIGGVADWGRPLVVGLVAAALLRGLFSALELRILRRLQVRLAVGQSSRFVRHLLDLPASYYAQRYAGEVSNRIASNDLVASLLSGQLATTGIDVLMMIFYLLIMLRFSVVLTLVASGLVGVNVVLLGSLARRRSEENIRQSMAGGRLAGVGVTGLQSIRTLKASGLESDFFARWAGHFANFAHADQELATLNFYMSALPPLVAALMTAAVLGVGGFETIHGRMSIGMLVAFQSLAISFLQPVNGLVSLGGSLQQLEAELTRLDDVLDSPSQPEPFVGNGGPSPALRLRGTVEFRNVTFGYSPIDKPMIENLSFRAEPGQRIAFVGGSGSGKSTILKLLTGVYPPNAGEILFDGIPLSELPREVLANSMAVVDQDILLFKGTVRDNLTLWDRSTSETSVREACRDALIEGAIDALPRGYASELLEGAANLSGGQRQRLEIARALATDPSILVMDEATSALDAETELAIDRNIRRRGATCVIVAHRLSTVRDSDEILVLERGRIAQRGTHDELMGQPGIYAALVSDGEMAGAAPA